GEEALQTASAPQEAAEIIRRMLEDETAFDETTDEERPAFDVLFDGEDPTEILKRLDERLELDCENGKLIVRRTIQFKEQEPRPCAMATESEDRNLPPAAKIIEKVKADFLEWSGGFSPESEDQIAVYIDYVGPAWANANDVRRILRHWLCNPENCNVTHE